MTCFFGAFSAHLENATKATGQALAELTMIMPTALGLTLGGMVAAVTVGGVNAIRLSDKTEEDKADMRNSAGIAGGALSGAVMVGVSFLVYIFAGMNPDCVAVDLCNALT